MPSARAELFERAKSADQKGIAVGKSEFVTHNCSPEQLPLLRSPQLPPQLVDVHLLMLGFESRDAFEARAFSAVVDPVLGALRTFAAVELGGDGVAGEVLWHQTSSST